MMRNFNRIHDVIHYMNNEYKDKKLILLNYFFVNVRAVRQHLNTR